MPPQTHGAGLNEAARKGVRAIQPGRSLHPSSLSSQLLTRLAHNSRNSREVNLPLRRVSPRFKRRISMPFSGLDALPRGLNFSTSAGARFAGRGISYAIEAGAYAKCNRDWCSDGCAPDLVPTNAWRPSVG